MTLDVIFVDETSTGNLIQSITVLKNSNIGIELSAGNTAYLYIENGNGGEPFVGIAVVNNPGVPKTAGESLNG